MELLANILKDVTSTLHIVLGALIAWLGSWYQNRLNGQAQKARLKAEKLERAYLLCQSIYDGHRREINNAKRYIPSEPGKFLEARLHPGMEMSELKMLIRSYTPALAASLDLLDTGHVPLKKAFRKLDEDVLNKHVFDAQALAQDFKKWDRHLQDLSDGANAIKMGLEQELLQLTK